jgi:hypothetical protein
MISYDRHKELEDYFWGNLAEQSDEVGEYASCEDSLYFLKEDV